MKGCEIVCVLGGGGGCVCMCAHVLMQWRGKDRVCNVFDLLRIMNSEITYWYENLLSVSSPDQP